MRLPYKSMTMPVAIGRDGPKTFRRSRSRLDRFHFTIPRRRVCNQRFEQMMRDMRDFIDRTIERFLVCFRRLGKSGKLANELKRRRANLFVRRRR